MKSVLITGATGFVGGAVAAQLLATHQAEDLIFIVRGKSQHDCLARLKKNISNFGVPAEVLVKVTDKNVIIGDLAYPENFMADIRLERVTHVINCAAIASFGKNPLIKKVNVDGTFKFAERMSRVKNLKRFLHVGTAMACTPEPHSLISEADCSFQADRHYVEYTLSKAYIENLMQEMLPELPLVIARPSIVVGHSKLGCVPSASIFWVFMMAFKLGRFLCEISDSIDIVPVDYCAKAIENLTFSNDIKYDIYHISAGLENSVTFEEIDLAYAKAAGTSPIAKNYEKISILDVFQMKKELPSLIGPCNEKIMLKAINIYGKFSQLDVVFDNSRLLKTGIAPPPKFSSYIGKCYESVKNFNVSDLMYVDFK